MTPGGSRLLGLITTVTHNFSIDEGFSTEFIVDSAGILGKPNLKDLIGEVSGRRTSSKLLYPAE